MHRAKFLTVSLVCVVLFVPKLLPAVDKTLPTPAQVFGFEPGAEGELASLQQIFAYFDLLDSLSDAVEVLNLGRTPLGNPFKLVLVSSPENLAHKKEILRIQEQLSDPERLTPSQIDTLVRQVPAIVSVNCSIHATEVGGAQMAPELVYQLVANKLPFARTILDSVLILLVPVHNPDGLALVHAWFTEHRNSRFETGPLPWLYNKYTGHDNNRDWFAFTQTETRLTVEKIYNVWHPQVVLDMHQMGRYGARLFVPPYVDPVDSNVAPLLVASMNDAGTFVQAWLTAQGLSGVVSSALFDAFTPARAYPNYHGAVRFLTEVASCLLTRPVVIPPERLRGTMDFDPRRRSVNFPLPWAGGVWSFEDVVTYHEAAAHALLLHVARNRRSWVRNSVAVLVNQCRWQGWPAGFLIPARQHDPSAAEDLVQILRTGLVKVFRVTKGQNSGALVVPLAQPYGAFAKTLLEVSHYQPPQTGGRERVPYDVTTHCLPLLFGVEVRPVREVATSGWSVEHFGASHESFRRDTRSLWLDGRANGAYAVVNSSLRRGARCWRTRRPIRVEKRSWPAGTFVLVGDPLTLSLAAQMADSLRVPWSVSAKADTADYGMRLQRGKVGLYQSWTASMDEGWTRWILEKYHFPLMTLHDRDFRVSRKLDAVHAIVIPNMSARRILAGRDTSVVPVEYAGGLSGKGLVQLRRFVERGGTLVLLGLATELADTALGLDLVAKQRLNRSDYRIPGALLLGIVRSGDVVTLGMPRRAALLCTTPPLLNPRAGDVLVAFAQKDSLLLSGWGRGVEVLRKRPALMRVRVGRGQIYAFAFRPQFRAWTRGTYKLFFNTLLHYTR